MDRIVLKTSIIDRRHGVSGEIQQLYNTERVGAEPNWISVSNQNYLGVIDCQWKLQSFALAMLKMETRHYADACAQQFVSVAEAWGVQPNITTVGTDGARNMIAAARKLPYEHMPYCASLIILCRYATELFGHKTYVSCSVVLPALCHRPCTMEVSDEDPAYIGKSKTAFKKDRVFKKGDREAVWTSLQALLENKPSTATPKPVEEPPKKGSLLIFVSDTDLDDDMVEPSRDLNHYKAEPTISMEECPLHNIVQKKRAALSSENVEKLVCLSDWLKENFRSLDSCLSDSVLRNQLRIQPCSGPALALPGSVWLPSAPALLPLCLIPCHRSPFPVSAAASSPLSFSHLAVSHEVVSTSISESERKNAPETFRFRKGLKRPWSQGHSGTMGNNLPAPARPKPGHAQAHLNKVPRVKSGHRAPSPPLI
ncbi:unnamed protein product [Menidia menidia]|uniref:(Atlantic silverside) hypothetical protein n=1 Tax=Menidia menidia TaxID=238744 RepID=A0A8S4AMP3_9TELE|nr:unnamed protein product [Menidia menidia]